MFDPERLEDIRRDRESWEAQELEAFQKRVPERESDFRTPSGLPVERLYTPVDLSGSDYVDKLGFPGCYPFTRGPYPTMYRARP